MGDPTQANLDGAAIFDKRVLVREDAEPEERAMARL